MPHRLPQLAPAEPLSPTPPAPSGSLDGSRSPLTLLLATSALLLGLGGPAAAGSINQDLWVANDDVEAVARAGNTIYIGGQFTYVGPATGGGAAVDATTGALQASVPKVNGKVLAVVSDGAGGWFIGGDFDAVGGFARSHLAHVAADHSVSAWDPGASAPVRTLALVGTTLYVGGEFGMLGGVARGRIAAVHALTAEVLAWDPNAPSGVVQTIVVQGSTVYVGGTFTAIGGSPRNRIAALDAGFGAATSWNPGANNAVHALAVDGTTVYAGGDFTQIGNATRNGIAALSTTSDTALAGWSAGANLTVRAIAVGDGVVYAGGSFTSIGGATRIALAELSASTGAATGWTADAQHPAVVYALAVSGTSLYVAGSFAAIGGAARENVAALSVTSGGARPWNPHAEVRTPAGYVRAVAVAGAGAYIGGDFFSVGGKKRNYLAALDATTGEATGWAPVISSNSGTPIAALATAGGAVYAGGTFTHVGGVPRGNLAAINSITGEAIDSWVDPDLNGRVWALRLHGEFLYVGGGFTTVRGVPRAKLAALDADDGGIADWSPSANGNVLAIERIGATVYVGGEFSMVDGVNRYRLAAIAAPGAGAVTDWDPGLSPGASIRALTSSGGRLFIGGTFSSIGGRSRSCLAAYDTSMGTIADWNPGADLTVNALAASGSRVVAGGAFQNVGGLPRRGLAVLDAGSGAVFPSTPIPGGNVFAVAAEGDVVHAGGVFDRVDNHPVACFFGFSYAVTGVASNPRPPAAGAGAWPNPFTDRVTLEFDVPAPSVLALEVFDPAGRRVWKSDGTTFAAGRQRLAWDGRSAAGAACGAGLYFLRVSGPGVWITKPVVRVR